MSKNQEAVEEHRDAKALLAVLDSADQMPSATRLRARSYELLSLVPDSTVVDVGCGAGRAVAELAERGVHAVGVDPSPRMLAAARKRWSQAEFREAGAEDLPFDDGSVRGYRADKVFHVLLEPGRAVAEARRVLCPGGRIVLVGQDWDAIMIDSADAALTRTIVHARADLLGTPRAGRQYRSLLLAGGFDDVTVEVHTSVFTDPPMLSLLARLAEPACVSGAVGRDQADEWLAEQRRRAEGGRFLVAIPFFVASASA
ncbi:methyltransferase domain-containing protein [Streptomyces botrytidirepellens]|uniref:Methyltransferase domain-containing protein n=1 Tax=Streptomyces botrytidirepellens TaxID=2486417 RepID=A0A3M8SMH2_9ACTN|nr:methyltransferase domain-containing protein [Streptomyces botrytidirepellens]RNF80020.1 methyltransferase domain-containing protein [Streptomyces botrytidirepellens]